MDAALSVLTTRAALASGWPRLWVMAPDEAEMLEARRIVEAILGPVPQADELEPWESGEAWLLRVDLPGVDEDDLARVVAQLGAAARLEPADPPGITEALDRGVLLADEIGDDVVARMLVDPAEGPVRIDLLRAATPDPELLELEAELVAALVEQDPALAPRSDRGPDTLAPVVARSTGRIGVELDVEDRRDEALRAVAHVVRARARRGGLQLQPVGAWDTRLGRLQLVLWLVAPPAAALPGDGRVRSGPPPLSWLDTLRRDAPGMVEDLEVQVVPASAGDHDAVAREVGAVASRAGWLGGRPRWLTTALGPAFAPVWRARPDQLVHVSSAAAVPRVYGVRVVPGEPLGLAEGWPVIDPAWRLVGDRCFARLRDARLGRDRLERVDERDADERDHVAAAEIPQDVRPIVDRRGRRGLEVELGAGALREEGLAPALEAAGAVGHPDVSGIGTLGFLARGARLRLWYRDPVSPGPRVWRDQPPK